MKLKFIASVPLLLLAGCLNSAQHSEVEQNNFFAYDDNSDGFISRAEFLKHDKEHEPWRSEEFNYADKNNDGLLGPEEFKNLQRFD